MLFLSNNNQNTPKHVLIYYVFYHGAAKYGKSFKNALSFASTLSFDKVGFSVKSSPPKMSSNSTVITSSANARPVKTLVPS